MAPRGEVTLLLNVALALEYEATCGQAEAIVTFNRWDLGVAPGRFGIGVLTPAEAIRRIRT